MAGPKTKREDVPSSEVSEGSLQYWKYEFLNPAVLHAINPHSTFGYAHGPIPNNDPDWRPVGTGRGGSIKLADIDTAIARGQGPTAPMSILNRNNTLVCDVLVGDNTMCGRVFVSKCGHTTHLLVQHPGATNFLGRKQGNKKQAAIADSAIKRWVLMGGWRDAYYREEPGRGSPMSPIGVYCDALEYVARNDVQFAAEYGTRFHRWGVSLTPGPFLLSFLKHAPPNQGRTQRQIAPAVSSGPDDHSDSVKIKIKASQEPGGDSDYDSESDSELKSEDDFELAIDLVSEDDSDIVVDLVSDDDSESEELEDWPVDFVTDGVARMVLPRKSDAASGSQLREAMQLDD